MPSIKEHRQILEQRKGKKEQLYEQIKTMNHKIRKKERSLKQHEQALEITRAVALRTQEQLQYHISDITSMALEAIFPDPYELKAEFVQRRNKTECDLFFEQDGQRTDPLQGSGGGPVDVASYALRIASWAMGNPRYRATVILDEPFKHLSVNLLPKASQVLKRISEELGLQVVMITHSEELVDCADKVFSVTQNKKITTVDV